GADALARDALAAEEGDVGRPRLVRRDEQRLVAAERTPEEGPARNGPARPDDRVLELEAGARLGDRPVRPGGPERLGERAEHGPARAGAEAPARRSPVDDLEPRGHATSPSAASRPSGRGSSSAGRGAADRGPGRGGARPSRGSRSRSRA